MPALTLNINGSNQHLEVSASETLLEVLRDRLALTGTKYGCGVGACAACTVLVDGVPKRSCRTAATAAAGKKIVTIEGLAQNGKLHPVQEAFLTEEAFQCGYCTPGMILSAAALLIETPHPTDAQIVQFMNGNICRCGTYPRIVAAVQRAATLMRRA
jgi:aerobic-type carbon monoxide dehydrogenase small subunit (CoxS/CutS family)